MSFLRWVPNTLALSYIIGVLYFNLVVHRCAACRGTLLWGEDLFDRLQIKCAYFPPIIAIIHSYLIDIFIALFITITEISDE